MEKQTRDLIAHCYSLVSKRLTIDHITGMICLTWWSPAEAAPKPKLDGIRLLFGISIEALDQLGTSPVPPDTQRFLLRYTGFVNFYRAYRNSAQAWIRRNGSRIQDLISKCAQIETDSDILLLAELLEELPRIPRRNNSSVSMPCASLLTPLLACIDPTGRFPIVNKNRPVQKLHAALGINQRSFVEKVTVLLDLMKDYSIPNSLVLDVVSDSLAQRALPDYERRVDSLELIAKKVSTDLLGKDDADVDYLVRNRRRSMIRLHNSMTNTLVTRCRARDLRILEGRGVFFDALIENYAGRRDLLIEVKSSNSASDIRLAIGQLLDYAFALNRKNLDLAIFVPAAPSSTHLRLLKTLNIHSFWFEGKRLKGTLTADFLNMP